MLNQAPEVDCPQSGMKQQINQAQQAPCVQVTHGITHIIIHGLHNLELVSSVLARI